MSIYVEETKIFSMSDRVKVFGSPNRANIGIITGSGSTLLIDSGHNEDHVNQLFSLLPSLQFDYTVLTHFHMDHTLGLAYLNCPGIAHKNMIQNLIDYRQKDFSDAGLEKLVQQGLIHREELHWYQREYPDRSKINFKHPIISYNNQLTLDLGNLTIELSHIACDHTNDTTVVYVPDEEALFIGDCLSPGPLPKSTFTMPVLRNMLDYFFSFDSKILVEGHGPPLNNGDGTRYLTDLLTVANFFEIYGSETDQQIDLIMTKMNMFDVDSVKVYVQLFMNGL